MSYYPLHEAPNASDAIVTLGCAARADGSPSPMLRSRVEEAVRLWKAGYAPLLIFTGAAVINDHVEAAVMGRLAAELGVPTSAILLEVTARNTEQNADRVGAILRSRGLSSAIVVTSPFHTRRARRYFASQSLTMSFVAAPYPQEIGVASRISLTLRDSIKLLAIHN